jgi:hypothetical protein
MTSTSAAGRAAIQGTQAAVLAARGAIKNAFDVDGIERFDASLAQSIRQTDQCRRFYLDWGQRKEAIGLINIVLALPELRGCTVEETGMWSCWRCEATLVCY